MFSLNDDSFSEIYNLTEHKLLKPLINHKAKVAHSLLCTVVFST